jgi:hypothetical protein
VAQGADGVLTGDDDHWYSPYHHADLAARDAGFQHDLDWELGLVAQLEREGTTGDSPVGRGVEAARRGGHAPRRPGPAG